VGVSGGTYAITTDRSPQHAEHRGGSFSRPQGSLNEKTFLLTDRGRSTSSLRRFLHGRFDYRQLPTVVVRALDVIDRHPEIVVVNTMPTRGVTAINFRLVLDLHAWWHVGSTTPGPSPRRTEGQPRKEPVPPWNRACSALYASSAPVVFSTCRLNQES
jgi:hypothetical protein